jgi:hypothetical protein
MDSVLLILVGLCGYFFPCIVAWARAHKNLAPILITNVFLGWTIFGWVIALAWSFTSSDDLQRSAR